MRTNTACPNDEMLADYVEHRLRGKMLRQVEEHLTGCADCREQVAVCAELIAMDREGASARVPEGVTRRAVDAVQGIRAPSLLAKVAEGIHRHLAKGAEAVERLTWQTVPAAAALRGDETSERTAVIRREKQFGALRVEIEIEKSSAGQAMIRVAGEAMPTQPPPVRVALIRREREVASALLGDVPVLFEEISLGTYSLVFVRQGQELGTYAFEIAG